MPFALTEVQLSKSEEVIGARFPSAYRERIKRLNGGAVLAAADVWQVIPIRDTTDRKRLSRSANHVILETRAFSNWRYWHENAYAIAENGSGDALVIFRKGPGFEPEVFVWRHEDGAIELVAKSFSDIRDA
jgi:hypothetical protein